MTWHKDWKETLKKLVNDDDFSFGKNMDWETKDVIRKFSKLEKLGAEIEMDIPKDNSYAPRIEDVRIFMPSNKAFDYATDGDGVGADVQILKYILTKLPPVSRARYKKVKKTRSEYYSDGAVITMTGPEECLELEWRF